MSTDIFRVIHTADWHLGKTLHDLDRYVEHSHFLDFLLQSIKDKQVDALIIAGDIFDSPNPPPTALKMYYEFLASVYYTTHCAIVITAGNHDSPAHLEAPKDVLKALNIHVIGTLPQKLEEALVFLPSMEQPRLAIAALPFLRDKDLRTSQLGQTQAEIQKSIQEGIRKRYHDIGETAHSNLSGEVAFIATGHLTVLGANKSESERDNIHIGGLGVVSTDVFPDHFSYVALGHLHRPQTVGHQEHFRYAGSPIPLSFSESADKKEVRILEFVKNRLINNEALEVPLVRQLFQLKTSYQDLEDTLQSFQPEPSSYPHWVELVIKADESAVQLHETIQRLTKAKPYQVIKIVIEDNSGLEGLRLNESCQAHSLGDLLGSPPEVFLQRLDQVEDLETEERESLVTAFAELYDLVLETQRHSFTSP